MFWSMSHLMISLPIHLNKLFQCLIHPWQSLTHISWHTAFIACKIWWWKEIWDYSCMRFKPLLWGHRHSEMPHYPRWWQLMAYKKFWRLCSNYSTTVKFYSGLAWCQILLAGLLWIFAQLMLLISMKDFAAPSVQPLSWRDHDLSHEQLW